MSHVRLEKREPSPKEYSAGLTEGKMHNLKCSNCSAPLVDILVTRQIDVEIDYKADCPHCGDASFKRKINGGVIYCHTDYTCVTDFEILPDYVSIRTAKVKEWKG